MDTLDVQREANKEVMRLATDTGMTLKQARAIHKDTVIAYYQIAVKYEAFPKGAEIQDAYLKGWRRGYGQ